VGPDAPVEQSPEMARPQWDIRQLNWETKGEVVVDALAEMLDARLRAWKPETAAEARERIAEIIELADHNVLDLARSRVAEQEVLDLLDEPTTR
jgi:hypothetical protein